MTNRDLTFLVIALKEVLDDDDNAKIVKKIRNIVDRIYYNLDSDKIDKKIAEAKELGKANN